MSKIEDGLKRLFEKHRIVFWYDSTGDFKQEYEEMNLIGVVKCSIENNEFALKYRILCKEPTTLFLLYGNYERPQQEDNWLLDIELGNVLFQTDQETLALQELELPSHFKNWINTHSLFFKNKERTARFLSKLEDRENEVQLTQTLLQIVLGSHSNSLDDLIKAYLSAFIAGKGDAIEKELILYNLNDFFWNLIIVAYQYNGQPKGIYDFAIEVCQKNFAPTTKKANINKASKVLLDSWRDTISFQKTYQSLIKQIETAFNREEQINSLDLSELWEEDIYECIDKKIIKELASLLVNGTLTAEKVESIIKRRESTYWYEKYQPFYEALGNANQLLQEVEKYENISIESYQNGLESYTRYWYKLDQYYRKFIQHYKETNQNNVLHALNFFVHRAYSNTWLPKLSVAWQGVIEREAKWYFGEKSQFHFFNNSVRNRFIEKDTTIFVVISDALRYECGQELHELFGKEIRFSSNLDYLVTGLPSYTQLGMAALLPHSQLSFGDGDSILIDGKNSIGKQARQKVLEEGSKVKAATLLAEELMNIGSRSEEAKKLVQENKVVYVYHNRIDQIGDNVTSESGVFEAARDEIQYLLDLTKKITNLNVNHVILTADHGFLYQNADLEESDFTDAQISGDITKLNRRFVLGKNLIHNNSVTKYSARELLIQGDLEVLIPKGINRLRQQGSGSRYVHGGATLQEVVIPVLHVNKRRTNTVSKVNIDVIKGSNKITTNIQRVKFYQEKAIEEGIIPRSIKSYFCELDGEKKNIISNTFTYTFDLESKRAEEREVEYKFTFSTQLKKSNAVFLLIEEQVDKSNKWLTLLKIPYQLNLTMENDFDDF
jgi:uncharacterized protein (TIGR02687 family)